MNDFRFASRQTKTLCTKHNYNNKNTMYKGMFYIIIFTIAAMMRMQCTVAVITTCPPTSISGDKTLYNIISFNRSLFIRMPFSYTT
jgi:hypothetical protein